jgi:osmoprotectant transport system permease protein
VAVVANVSGVSIAALIGIPQLGSLFTEGFELFQLLPVILGIVLSVLIALVLDWLVLASIHRLTPWSPKKAVVA